MKNFKYFKCGITTDAGLPTYALYCPTLDCFLYVLQDIKLAFQLRFLLSSKYFLLFVIRINCAKNYYPQLIDNESCINWSFTNKNVLNVAQIRYFTFDAISAEELCNAKLLPLELSDIIDLQQEQQWIMMVDHWLRQLLWTKLNNFSVMHDDVSRALDLRFLDPDPHSSHDRFKKIEQQVLQILYVETDFEKADSQVSELLTDNYY